MNISILQGPNMNLLGLQSSDRKQILTSDGSFKLSQAPALVPNIFLDLSE